MNEETTKRLILIGAAMLAGGAALPLLPLLASKTDKTSLYIAPGLAIGGGAALAVLVKNPIAIGAGAALASLGVYELLATYQTKAAGPAANAATTPSVTTSGMVGVHPGGGGGGSGHAGPMHGGAIGHAAPMHAGHPHPHPHWPPWRGVGPGWGWWGPGWVYVTEVNDCVFVLDPQGNEWCVLSDGTRRMTRTAAQVNASARVLASGNLRSAFAQQRVAGTLPPSFSRRYTGLHRTWANIQG